MRTPQQEAWKTWPLPSPDFDVMPGLSRLYEWQEERCAWCGAKPKVGLVMDHCHFTGLVRGWLCNRCNIVEGKSCDPIWDGWRDGDNPAFALKHFEIYTNRMGVTPIGPFGALHYYTGPERTGWFKQIVLDLEAGAPWPEDAPWTEVATSRKEAQDAQIRAVMATWSLTSKGGAA